MRTYHPKGIFRNGHANSIFSGAPVRRLLVHRQCAGFMRAGVGNIIPAQHGIRLSAVYNLQAGRSAPLVILMHGWLGCAASLYLVTLGDYLFRHGFSIVRLNFRDHGDSQHLNERLFHSCRIQEVINACIYIQKKFNQALSIIGFSLGANFALRVNAYTTQEQLDLKQTIAFCPVMDPASTLHCLEQSLSLYRHYFMLRWKQAFYKKVAAFPHLYSRQTFDRAANLREATENLATRYAGFNSLQDYLDGYAITGERLATLQAAAQVVLAKDDPIIPWRDESRLCKKNTNLKILISKYGGHCGFLGTDFSSSWINRLCLQALQKNRE